MQITKVYPQYNTIFFAKGKVSLYSDFDGTYMPFCQSDFEKYKNNPVFRFLVNKTYAPFFDISKKMKDAFDFIITTGRTNLGFKYFLDSINNASLNIPLPSKIITNNGADTFYKNNNSYPENCIDMEKRKSLADEMNWHPEDIIPKIKKVIKDSNINVINYGQKEEGDFAIFYKGYDFSPTIVFSSGVDLDKLSDKLDELFVSEGLDIDIRVNSNRWLNVISKYQTLDIKPRNHKGKLYDTHKKVEQLVQNQENDLVIVSGDSDNDIEMLDIFNYVDIFGKKVPYNKEKFLKNEKNRELIEKLPIMMILVGVNPYMGKIRYNQKILDKYGIKKTIFVPYLPDGLKQAIKTYSLSNKEFKNALLENISSKSSEFSSI